MLLKNWKKKWKIYSMYIDNYKAIRMEQVAMPGAVGDSCSETARYAHLKMLLGDYYMDVNLNIFVTPLGYIRHPEVPDDWKEKDFSEDQGKPLFLAFKRAGFPQVDEMKRKIVGNSLWGRMGNGDPISPGFKGILNDWGWLRDLTVIGQSLIFKLPYRWSDSKKWFERSEGSSGDYLNHIHMAVYSPQFVRRLVSKEILKQKVRDYYKPEPNSQWIIDLYDKVLEEYW